MLKILYQLFAIILSIIWPVFAFAKWILSVAGIGTVQDDLPQTLELVWPIAAWIIDMPWWFLGRVDKRDSHRSAGMIQAGICDGDQLGTRPDVGRGMGLL